MPSRLPTRPTIHPRTLALAVLVWTLVSWGGRVGLLGRAEVTDAGDLARIGGSLLIGWVTSGVLWWAPLRLREVRWLFVVWTVVLWTRSLVVTWADGASVAFGLVHTALALVWFLLAWLVAPPRHERAVDSTRVSTDVAPRT